MSTTQSTCPNCGKSIEDCAASQNNFGNSFREIREETGKTQEEFASIIGEKEMEVSLIEQGKVRPTVDQIVKFADALGKSPFEFTDRSFAKSKFFSQA